MPVYCRNADGDELIFVHRGEGTIETDCGPCRSSAATKIVVPRAVTCRILPDTGDNFFLIVHSCGEFDQPDKDCWASTHCTMQRRSSPPDPAALLDDSREWEIGGRRNIRRFIPSTR